MYLQVLVSQKCTCKFYCHRNVLASSGASSPSFLVDPTPRAGASPPSTSSAVFSHTSMALTFPFERLNVDVQLYIFRFWTPKQLATVSRVSKWFNKLSADDSIWEKLYYKELSAMEERRREKMYYPLDPLHGASKLFTELT